MFVTSNILFTFAEILTPMARLETHEVLRKEVQTVKSFADSLAVSSSAVYYAIREFKVDFCVIEGTTYIVMTPFTRQYTPNKYPGKVKPAKKVKRKVSERVIKSIISKRKK